MKYNHLSIKERYIIDILFNKEHRTKTYIANLIGRSISTISRELKRNFNEKKQKYEYWRAEQKAKRRSKHKYMFRLLKYQSFINFFYKNYKKEYHGVDITYQLAKTTLPEKKIPSLRQLYNWIKNRNFKITKRNLIHPTYVKGRRRKRSKVERMFDHWVLPIGVRPKSINERSEIGHWEIDTIMGQKAHGNHHLLTMVDRKSRFVHIKKVPSRSGWKMLKMLEDLIKTKQIKVLSLTTDNGWEFSRLGILAKKLNIKVYLCEPYCSFQKGTNENLNGLVRRTWPKTTRFNNISEEEIQKVADLINSMPRKMFGYKSAKDIHNQ